MGDRGRRARVLVVDDAAAMREIAAFTLEAMGSYDVEAADSGSAALEMLESGDFDVLLTDFSMDGMNGIQLAEAVRLLPGGDRMPIILMTFDDDRKVRDAAEAAGVDGFVNKPFEPDDIRDAIESVLPEPVGALPTASGYMLLGVQSVLDAMPYPAMVMNGDHDVMLANRAFFETTKARFGDCGLRCADAMHSDGVPVDCPLRESVATGRRVERIVADSVVGPVHVSVYPIDITDGEGGRLYLHLTRPAVGPVHTRH